MDWRFEKQPKPSPQAEAIFFAADYRAACGAFNLEPGGTDGACKGPVCELFRDDCDVMLDGYLLRPNSNLNLSFYT